MKQTVQKIVYDVTMCDEDKQPATWPPKRVEDFLWWLTSIKASIPPLLRDSAEIVFTGEYRDGDTGVRCVVSFNRLETDEEEQIREEYERLIEDANKRNQQQSLHLALAREIKYGCNAEQKRQLLALLKKECGE